MRTFNFYWLEFCASMEALKEEYGLYIAFFWLIVLLGLIDALKIVLMGL